MRVSIISILLMLFAIPAYSASWKLISTTEHGKAYIDVDSVKKVKKGKKFWVKLDYVYPQRTNVHVAKNFVKEIDYYQVKVLHVAKCEHSTLASMQAMFFDKKGNMLGIHQYPKKLQFSEIVPDSNGEKALKVVCGKSKSRKKK